MQIGPPVLRPEHPTPRSLTEFARHFGLEVHGSTEGLETVGISLSTGDLRPGELFVAIHGRAAHGASFAPDAVATGAVAIVTDAEGAAIAAEAGVPVLVTDDPRGHLAEMSAWVYGTAEANLTVLGVTGTNGKTTVVHLQHALLTQLGVVAGMSSTARRFIGTEQLRARLTTPEATELHAQLALMVERGVEVFALEVSAQGLSRHRVDGVDFDVSAFTNLQVDHLEDFPTFDEYLAAKMPMFRAGRTKRAVVSLDTPAGKIVADTARGDGVPVTTIAAPQIALDQELAATADWTVTALEADAGVHTRFTLSSADGTRSLTTTSPVLGPHMIANSGIAILTVLEAGFAWEDIVRVLERDGGIQAVLPGRTEIVTTGRGPIVYLDYGHTPEGIEYTTKALREVVPGRLITMIGGDGGRDTRKRAPMGAASARWSDAVVVTDHQPRWDDAAEIRAHFVEGALAENPEVELYNVSPPEDAIKFAVTLLGEHDALVWYGPGHQYWREVMGVRYDYDPFGLALDALERAGWGTTPETSAEETASE